MSESQVASIVAFIMLALMLVVYRRLIFARTVIGIFVLSHCVFVYTGILAIPWLLPWLGETVAFGESRVMLNFFSHIPFWMFTQAEIVRGIVISVGGGIIVFASYLFFNCVLSNRQRSLPAIPPPADGRAELDFDPSRLYILSFAALAVTCLLALPNRSMYLYGIRHGIMYGDPRVIIEARQAVGANLLLVILTFNILPFFSVALWLHNQTLPKQLRSWVPWFYVATTSVFLLLTFQKRPLVLFLLTLALATRWLHAPVDGASRMSLLDYLRRRSRELTVGATLFAIVVLLYAGFTTFGRNGESRIDTILSLGIIAVTRIVFRLASPAVMYSHYFPLVEGHYGFTNVGVIARLFGFQRYQDTAAIFEYCGGEQGGTAVGMLVDFYGAFGFFGWAIGCIVVGLILCLLDRGLAHLRRRHTILSVQANVFAVVFVYYLSQSSFYRALNGYGGLWFLFCLMLLAFQSRRSFRRIPGTAPGSASMTAPC